MHTKLQFLYIHEILILLSTLKSHGQRKVTNEEALNPVRTRTTASTRRCCDWLQNYSRRIY